VELWRLRYDGAEQISLYRGRQGRLNTRCMGSGVVIFSREYGLRGGIIANLKWNCEFRRVVPYVELRGGFCQETRSAGTSED